MPRISLCTIFLLLAAGLANGQTTRPATEPWAKAVQQFGQALTQADPAVVANLLADQAVIRGLDGKNSDPLRLLSRTRNAVVVAARAYVHAPTNAAADIATAFRDSDVPDELKRYMTPQDDSQMARANAAATRWLTEALSAREGDLVAVIALWCTDSTLNNREDPAPEVVFVLVKGIMAGPGPQVQTIAFGNPRRPGEQSP